MPALLGALRLRHYHLLLSLELPIEWLPFHAIQQLQFRHDDRSFNVQWHDGRTRLGTHRSLC